MAIINSYPKDINIQDKDAWIGTDSFNRQTRQYTAEALAKYLNVKGKVSIAGQVNYQFINLPKTKAGTMAFPAGGGDGTPFSSITSFTISNTDLSGQTVVAYLNYLVNQEILIGDQLDKESFGHYKIESYVVNPDNSSFYDITVSYIGGNGSIVVDKYYDLVNFSFEKDKSFIFTQGAPSTVWTIQHNMDKFPSVSVVNNNNVLMYGETTYVDKNNLTINFSAGFSGKAYLN